MSTEHVTVHQAWNACMADIQGIKKGDRNKQQGFNFRGIDAVMNAVGPVLRKHGVIVVPSAEDIRTSSYETKGGTTMYSAIVKITFKVTGPGGDEFAGCTYGEASDASDKAVSKAHSVAYRTFLLQALTIPTDEPDPDPDAESHERAPSLQNQLQRKVAGLGTEGRANFLARVAEAGLPTRSADMTEDQVRQALELV